MMKKILMPISLTLIACSPNSNQETIAEKSQRVEKDKITYTGSFSVPADARAKYVVVGEVVVNAKGYAAITTERQGPSGTSYTTREVDCSRMLVRYTADADTLEEASLQNFDSEFGPLVAGSSTDTAARYACNIVGK
ncbi:hypothetical protein [Fretibacter rubidus]|uniref:hypothetical protein n=1 Tax=Fretibacter rubidus TaxID=570162 RepID=UPI00352BAF1F